MTEAELVEQLLTLPDVATQKRCLEEHKLLLNDEVARLLDLQVAHFLRADILRTFEIARLLRYIGELTNNPGYVAWSRVNEGDAHGIGLGGQAHLLPRLLFPGSWLPSGAGPEHQSSTPQVLRRN